MIGTYFSCNARGTYVTHGERQSRTGDVSHARGTPVTHRGRKARTGDVSDARATPVT